MILRAIAAGLLAVTTLIPTTAHADDWTPIEPVPSGCADDGIYARATDTGLKIVVPIAADWQIGHFKVDGVRRDITVVKQVVDLPHCQGYRIRVDAPDSGNWVRYAWFGADGAFLESGSLRVR